MIVPVVVTLDRGATLLETLDVLRGDLPGTSRRIVVVAHELSERLTRHLERQRDVELLRPASGSLGGWRNAGIDAVRDDDDVLLLDGGVVPVIGAVDVLRRHLERHPEIDVVGPAPACFTPSRARASRRMPDRRLSSTFRSTDLAPGSFCLARSRAFHAARFPDTGPFAEPGLGVEDVVLAARWARAGVAVELFADVTPYRLPPTVPESWLSRDFGSVYERRFVRYSQEYADHRWGGIDERLIAVSNGDWRAFARLLRTYRSQVADRRHDVVFVPDDSAATRELVFRHADRFQEGDRTVASDGREILREPSDDSWCGDFRTAESLEASRRLDGSPQTILLADLERQTWTPLEAAPA